MRKRSSKWALCGALTVIIGAGTMGWFWNRKRTAAWDPSSLQPPWRGVESIYAHITKHVRAGTKGLAEGAERLPDDKQDSAIRWVAGGMDGVFGHHMGDGQQRDRAARIHQLLRRAVADGSATKLKELYDALLQGSSIEYVDPLIDELSQDTRIDADRLDQLVVWLAKNAPDREPVKVAIALLGLKRDERNKDLLMTLGRHEEFTLFAAVALVKLKDGESNLFELAQNVDGWGRIHIVERLADNREERIKSWMLREGYKNSMMNEYLAYTCATAGGLRAALEKKSVDQELLAGAGDLIQALLNGGPAQDIDDYAEGAAVVELYLRHLGPEPKRLDQLLVVESLLQFLNGKTDWKPREARGWTADLRARVRASCVRIKSQPYWTKLINEGLSSRDRVIFAQADHAAHALGMDTWDKHFARLVAGEDDGWYFVMQTTDAKRIDRVIALAEKRIPLEKIATGPGKDLGLGPQWALDFVLQDLRLFPGKGWPLIRAGLRSPVIRNRHMALRALSKWGKNRWPEDAQRVLEQGLKEEPDESVRNELQTVLAGKTIEDPKPQAH